MSTINKLFLSTLILLFSYVLLFFLTKLSEVAINFYATTYVFR